MKNKRFVGVMFELLEQLLDTEEISEETKKALAARTDLGAVRDGQNELERTRNLKDILRSTIGIPKDPTVLRRI